MPLAGSFSEKAGEPPVIHAYRDDARQELIGYVFTTPDVPPEEIGFSGTIHMLIGMNLNGELTGVKVLHYVESYKSFRGDFIADSGIVDQLARKSVSDEFRPGVDVDAISRATITSWALARGARNAARRVAETYLTDTDFGIEASNEISALQQIDAQHWYGLIDEGFVREFTVDVGSGSSLSFSVAYMGHGRLGEMLIGARDYSNLERVLSEREVEGNLMLLGMRGSTARLQQKRLAVVQDGTVYPAPEGSVLFAGTGGDGKISGSARLAVALLLDSAIDPQRPFSLIYGTGPVGDEFSSSEGVLYTLPAGLAAFLFGAAEPARAGEIERVSGSPDAAGILAAGILILTLILVAAIHLRRRLRPE